MSLKEFAENELKEAGMLPGKVYDELIANSVIELIDLFEKQKLDKFAQATVLSLFDKLARKESINLDELVRTCNKCEQKFLSKRAECICYVCWKEKGESDDS